MEMKTNLKDLFAYLSSKENKKACEPFEILNTKYTLLQNKYRNSFQQLNEDAIANANRREYSKGGETIHRGFYSPSSLDLVVGGCNRGRLYKNIRKNSKYDYEYIFDDKGKLICARTYTDQFGGIHQVYEIEFILYEPDKVTSLVYMASDHELHFMSECQYDKGKLYRYESVLCSDQQGGMEINAEEIEYANDLMQTVLWSNYNRSVWLLSRVKFNFTRDKEGKLSTYTVEKWDCMKDVWDQDPRVFNVRRSDK